MNRCRHGMLMGVVRCEVIWCPANRTTDQSDGIRCYRCKSRQPPSEFYRRPDGRHYTRCRTCWCKDRARSAA